MTILERRTRLIMALGSAPWIPQDQIELFQAWLEAQPLAFDERCHYQLLASASLDKISLLVDGPPPVFEAFVAGFLEDAQAGDEESQRLSRALELLPVQQLGSWLSAAPEGPDGGWILTLETGVKAALPLLDASSDLDRFLEWLEQNPGLTLIQFSRSVGEPTPESELLILLPESDGAAEQYKLVGRLYGELGLPRLESELIQAMLEEGADEPALIVSFTGQGVSRLGIAFGQPERRLSLMLAGLVDEQAHLKMAMIEGTLQVEAPELLRFSVRSDGWQTELLYQM